MKVGVSLTTSFPRSLDAKAVGRQLVERASVIREAGLDSLFVGDHHATPSHYFQNVPLLARLLAEVGDMMVGALYLMPLHHPVMLAEQAGTLAALAEGPFVLIAAVGDDESQFAPFGVPLKQRPSRTEEHLEIATRLLAGERLTYEGRYHTLKDVSISPVPAERIPVWIGASARPALQRAAVMGDAWLATPGSTGETLATAANIYRQAAAAVGRRPVLTTRRDVYVGESDAEAEESAAPVLARGYRGFRPEALVIGGPDTVIEEFRALHAMGFEHVLVRHIVPDQEKVLASYRRLGNEVLPAVRELT